MKKVITNLNNDLLNKYLTEDKLIINKHPKKNLFIVNYSRNTQFNELWDDVTLSCRGLVIDSNGNIIARGFKKFFNIEEYNDSEIPKKSFEVFEKMDGSLGILFFYDGEWIISTKGSFVSEQAVAAKEMIKGLDSLNKKYTYLFEVIYKSNRIVVDYSDREELVLLAAIETESGVEMSYNKLVEKYNKIYSIVPRYDNATDLMKLKGLDLVNKEGFVVRFKNGLRIKIKFAEYVRLHAILTQMSNLVIWRSLRWGHDLDMKDVPDEFDGWVKDTMKDLLTQFGEVKYEINKRYYSIIRKTTDDENLWNTRKHIETKEFALLAKEHGKKYFGYLMMKFNQKDIDDTIWRELRPTYSLPFLEEE